MKPQQSDVDPKLARVGHEHVFRVSWPGYSVFESGDRCLVDLDRGRDLNLDDPFLLSALAASPTEPGEEGARNVLGAHP